MPTDAPADIEFSIPFVNRLRFTRDILGADEGVLLDLLEPSGDLPPRVQFWVDESIAQAQPDMRHRLRAFVMRHEGRITPTGNIQILPGGETVKNDIHLLERMLKVFHAANLDRRSYIVVIGGGAVLDAVGFAAAIAHRGIRLIRVPTTTLAQADSGVGVKNSVNLFHKKNWLGTFAVPWGIINDSALLSTLPDRDFVCGFSETVKVTLLKDASLFNELCNVATRIRERDMTAAEPMIRVSAELHRAHITRGGDPFEALEARPLDYGHWSAHKLEVMSDFQLKHGEAVAIGVAVDTVYSSLMFGLPKSDVTRVLQCLDQLGLVLDHPVLHDTATLFAGLEEFRQHLGGRLTLTMLEEVGRPLEVHTVDYAKMGEAIAQVAAFAKTQQSGRRKQRAN